MSSKKQPTAKPATAFLDRVRGTAAPDGAPRRAVPTGFGFLDQAMGGWRTGLHLVSGAPGSGKSAFALHAAAAAARQGFPVLYAGFELELDVLVLRLLCREAGLDLRQALDGALDGAQVQAACDAQRPLFDRIDLLRAEPLLDMASLNKLARETLARASADVGLIVVDYLQVWAAGNRDFSEFRHEIAKLTAALRHLAVDLDSPVLALSSQSRQAQGEPLLSSLEGTSDLEYTADSVTFLIQVERPARQNSYGGADEAAAASRTISLNLRKNRFGDTGSRVVRFLPATGAFKEDALPRSS